jgi:hypothetical protein
MIATMSLSILRTENHAGTHGMAKQISPPAMHPTSSLPQKAHSKVVAPAVQAMTIPDSNRRFRLVRRFFSCTLRSWVMGIVCRGRVAVHLSK